MRAHSTGSENFMPGFSPCLLYKNHRFSSSLLRPSSSGVVVLLLMRQSEISWDLRRALNHLFLLLLRNYISSSQANWYCRRSTCQQQRRRQTSTPASCWEPTPMPTPPPSLPPFLQSRNKEGAHLSASASVSNARFSSHACASRLSKGAVGQCRRETHGPRGPSSLSWGPCICLSGHWVSM